MHLEHDVPLAPKTTLGLGGRARRFVRATSVDELKEALSHAERAHENVLVLGGGSNLVVGDEGWDGLVVQIDLRGVAVRPQGQDAVVSAFAGEPWDDFVASMVDSELAGVECLSGIPGLVGATPMQNVGAYGQEVADTIVQVRALDRTTGEVVTFQRGECAFSYRSSLFKGSSRWVVIEVQFRFARSIDSTPVRYAELARALGIAEGERAVMAEVRRVVIELRRGKGMVVDPADPESQSAGSFFVNPILDGAGLVALRARAGGASVPCFAVTEGRTKVSAAWLIEQAGFVKGYTMGRVGISKKHALALVNRGGTARELLDLARAIQDRVREEFGVELVREPVVVG